jgi:hypothetical protein
VTTSASNEFAKSRQEISRAKNSAQNLTSMVDVQPSERAALAPKKLLAVHSINLANENRRAIERQFEQRNRSASRFASSQAQMLGTTDMPRKWGSLPFVARRDAKGRDDSE